MNKKMYEVNWHSVGDKFSHCAVTAITVTREGILPGCTGVTITATDHEGRKFQGSPGKYHNTEAEAWAEVKVVISETIKANESSIANLVNETNALREYLTKVGASGTAPDGHNAPHEGPGAASSRTVPLDAVVWPRIGEKE